MKRMTEKLTHSVCFWKTIEDREYELGVPVRVVGKEDTEGVHQHLVEAAGEHGLGQFPQVLFQ